MSSAKKTIAKRWTTDEEKDLLNNLENNMSIEDISKKHERPIGGIKTRIEMIAYNMYNDDISIDNISEQTKLSEEEINKLIETKNKSITKKKEKKEKKEKQDTKKDVNKMQNSNTINLEQLEKKIEEMSQKLDRIIEILEKSNETDSDND